MKFQVGDRVICFGKSQLGVWDTDAMKAPYKGVVESFDSNGWLCVRREEDSTYKCFFHPKQCRKLVKKPRRRVWIWNKELNEWPRTACAWKSLVGDGPLEDDWVEFVEVRRKR